MGKYRNTKLTNAILVLTGVFVTALNVMLLVSL